MLLLDKLGTERTHIFIHTGYKLASNEIISYIYIIL